MESDPSQYYDWWTFLQPLWLDAGSSAGLFISLGLIALLLMGSALISGSEVAFFSLTPSHLVDISKSKQPGTRRILGLLDKPRYLLSTILITNNFINIATVLVSKYVLDTLLPPEALPDWANFLITAVLVTFFLVLFGEVAPKVYAEKNNVRLATMMSRPLFLLRYLFRPFSFLLVSSGLFLEKRLSKHAQNGNLVSNEDIAHAIELAIQDPEGVQDVDLLKSIVRFGNIPVENVMCSRVDMVAIDNSMSFEEVLAVFRETSFSRIPVYEDDMDNIKGILHSKDLLEHVHEAEAYDWHVLVRTSFFIPESRKIDALFRDFKAQRTHMAIVVDEYGGTSGVVTMEDVLEEIVGEIKDEFDEQNEIVFTKLDENNFIFDGKTLLPDVARAANLEPDFFDNLRDSKSIAGLLLEVKGEMPKRGEEIEYECLRLVPTKVSRKRIEKIRLSIHKTTEDYNTET